MSFLRRGGHGLRLGPRSETVDQLLIGILFSNLAHISALQVPDMAAIAIVQSIRLSKAPRSSWVCPQSQGLYPYDEKSLPQEVSQRLVDSYGNSELGEPTYTAHPPQLIVVQLGTLPGGALDCYVLEGTLLTAAHTVQYENLPSKSHLSPPIAYYLAQVIH